jgi:uncharacterized protein YdeI (YjbR/CyaY-like superfamily)
MNPTLDFYFSNAKKWQKELELLRSIVLDCGLTEELKWKVPCYTYQNSNIIIIHAFKEYCALLFFNGALLNDANDLLIQQTENVQAGRQIRFTNSQEIVDLKNTLKAYIFEAVEVEKAGLKVELKKHTEYKIVAEFQNKLAENPALKTAFEALTPGRQRGYLLYFSAPKQAKTIELRIENSIPLIFKGKGLTDCTCGLSKKMPTCDGSHKQIRKENVN